MFLEFPGPGGRLDPVQSLTGCKHLSMRLLRSSRYFLLPLLLLAFGAGCSHKSDHASDPGTPPAITTAPASATTVAGRQVSFSVLATGAPTLRYQWAKDDVDILGALSATLTIFSPRVQDSGQYTVTITNPDGKAKSSAATLTVTPALQFTAAVSVVSDASGNLLVSDLEDHCIWKVSPAKVVTLLAGTQGIPGSADGQGLAARFRNPGGLALDASGNLLVADTGNHTLRRVAPDGTVTTLAGSPGVPGTLDAVGTLARFNGPYGLAVDGTGGVYISDSQNHTIRLMATDGTVSTYAGKAGQSGSTDASGGSARFDQPNGLALASNGTLYVADYGNSCLRVIAPSGQVSTLAGLAGTPAYADGTGSAARFNLPVGIALDASGNLWIADTHNHAVRRVTPAGVVTVIAGSGSAGNIDGTGAAALFNQPCGITLLPTGNLLVVDTHNHLLRLLTPAGVVTTL